MLLVTHDQDLMEEVGTRVWHFEHGRIADFKGTLRGTDGDNAESGERRAESVKRRALCS